MQIYDPSTVSNNSEMLKPLLVPMNNGLYFDSDEIITNENDFTIELNNNSIGFDNIYYNESANSNNVFIYADEYEIVPSSEYRVFWELYKYKIMIKESKYESVKTRLNEFRNQTKSPVFKLTVELNFVPTLKIDRFNWSQKYFLIDDQTRLFRIQQQNLGYLSSDTISTNFTYLNNSSREIFEIHVHGYVLFGQNYPRINGGNIKVEITEPRINPRTITSSIYNSSNEETDNTKLEIFDTNKSIQLSSDGVIQSKNLQLVGENFSITNNKNNTMSFNYLNKDVITLEPIRKDNELITQVKLNSEFLRYNSSDTYLTIQDGAIGMKQPLPLVVFEINKGQPKLLKSKGIKQFITNENQIKLVFDTKQDIYFPQIQFSSNTNNYSSFSIRSSIVEPIDYIILETENLNDLNGILCVKIN